MTVVTADPGSVTDAVSPAVAIPLPARPPTFARYLRETRLLIGRGLRMIPRVPERLSVVGIDDHAYAEMFSLTTLQQKPHQHGRAAVQLLMWQLDDPDAPTHRLYESSPLVVRNSTAPVDDQASAVIGVGSLGTP